MQRVAIIGAGTMGSGIAMACANAGLDVRLYDTSQEALDRGLGAHPPQLRRPRSARGRFTADMVSDRLAPHPSSTRRSTAFDTADVIIEAVFEELALKQQVFAELDKVARPGAVLGNEHVDARHRRDRVADRAGRRTSSGCTSSAPRTSCGCSKSCAAGRHRPRRWRRRSALPRRWARSASPSATARASSGTA